jgi:hypothetical protein
MLLDDYRKVGAAKLITTLPLSGTRRRYYFPVIYVLDLYIFRNLRAYVCQPIYSDSQSLYSRFGINISKSGEESISSQSSIFSFGITSERGS